MTEGRRNAPDGFTVLREFGNRIDAELFQGLLADRGVEALIRADDAGGAYPSLSALRGVQLLVRTEDAESAETILREAAEADDEIVSSEPEE